ncbi:hypothetical protein KIPB_014672, partial [Kipferlia bialata]
ATSIRRQSELAGAVAPAGCSASQFLLDQQHRIASGETASSERERESTQQVKAPTAEREADKTSGSVASAPPSSVPKKAPVPEGPKEHSVVF